MNKPSLYHKETDSSSLNQENLTSSSTVASTQVICSESSERLTITTPSGLPATLKALKTKGTPRVGFTLKLGDSATEEWHFQSIEFTFYTQWYNSLNTGKKTPNVQTSIPHNILKWR